ncbi:YkvA family protein [Calidithermus timidus]|uniref:YkvA family protein n=1 Tax=Calidithermus timidus TaxID=307124 RepID=UPI00039D969D|nr:YkvA family protein [Calidithermus timidus]
MAEEIRLFSPPKLETTERLCEPSFWDKVRRFARKAGREVVEKALWLYYAYQRPETPLWAKRAILGALAYFILPVDAISDILVGVGYTDDLTVLTVAVGTVAAYINPAVKEQARRKVNEWFGDQEGQPL